jgi:hypothetical protein
MSENTYPKVFSDAITYEMKGYLIKALVATVRWRANYKEHFAGDDESLEMISQLILELADSMRDRPLQG